jgi:hypothetical protein
MDFGKPFGNGVQLVEFCLGKEFDKAKQFISDHPALNLNELRHSLLGYGLLHIWYKMQRAWNS